MSVYVVRESPARDRAEPNQLFWQGPATDAIEAAMLATVHGPFPLDYGEMRVYNSDTLNLIVVPREERDWRMDQLRKH